MNNFESHSKSEQAALVNELRETVLRWHETVLDESGAFEYWEDMLRKLKPGTPERMAALTNLRDVRAAKLRAIQSRNQTILVLMAMIAAPIVELDAPSVEEE